MKFNAEIVHLTARKADDDRVSYAEFAATDEHDAARKAADWDAVRKYGDEGIATNLIEVSERTFFAFVGVGAIRDGGFLTTGVSAKIRIIPVAS